MIQLPVQSTNRKREDSQQKQDYQKNRNNPSKEQQSDCQLGSLPDIRFPKKNIKDKEIVFNLCDLYLKHQEKGISKQERLMSYYKVLNLEETAKEEDIKKAYRQKALEYHPVSEDSSLFMQKDQQLIVQLIMYFIHLKDRTTYEIEEAREKFRELDEAYKVLSNDDKRALYDVYHRHKEEIEKNTFLNPRIVNSINKMYIELEQEQQKQSVVNDVMLEQMPSIDTDLLLKIYDSRYHKNQKYYQQQARKICQFLEQNSQDDSSNNGNSSINEDQQFQKNQWNPLNRDLMIVEKPRRRDDKIETNTIEQFLKQLEEQKGNKSQSNIADQIQRGNRKDSFRQQTTGFSSSSKKSKTFAAPSTNFEEFHQKYFDLINSFAGKEDKTQLINKDSIQRYADCYDYGTVSMPCLSIEKDENSSNKQQQQQQLTKKQIKHIWELTQQKKVKQRIIKKKPVFILKQQLQKERKPIKLAELQQKIAEVQSQIQQQKQHYQKIRNRKEPLEPSILEISRQKYLELVQRKKLLTQQSFSLQRDDQQKGDTQPSKYGLSCEQYYNQLKADLNSSESQDNQISDQQQANNQFEEDEDGEVYLHWNGGQQEGEDEELGNLIGSFNEQQSDDQTIGDSLEENASISLQQLDQIEKQPEILNYTNTIQQEQSINQVNYHQNQEKDLDLSLLKDSHQPYQQQWQDQFSQEIPFKYPNEMKSILSQQQQQEYQLQQRQKLRPNTNIIDNSSLAIPLKDSPFQIQEDLPGSLQGSPFREHGYQDTYDLNYIPSFLHQQSYQDQIYSPSLFESQLNIPYQDSNFKDIHDPIPSFTDQL